MVFGPDARWMEAAGRLVLTAFTDNQANVTISDKCMSTVPVVPGPDGTGPAFAEGASELGSSMDSPRAEHRSGRLEQWRVRRFRWIQKNPSEVGRAGFHNPPQVDGHGGGNRFGFFLKEIFKGESNPPGCHKEHEADTTLVILRWGQASPGYFSNSMTLGWVGESSWKECLKPRVWNKAWKEHATRMFQADVW